MDLQSLSSSPNALSGEGVQVFFLCFIFSTAQNLLMLQN